MSTSKRTVAVIGAGVMGLTAAYELLKSGHAVDVYEKEERIGGMSSSFDFDGLTIERFYHFICGPDHSFFDLLRELGIHDRLKWRATRMGFFFNGTLYKWGNPLHLMRFPGAGLSTKLRYGLHLFLTSKRTRWNSLDRISAYDWLNRNIGRTGYDLFWKTLLEL